MQNRAVFREIDMLTGEHGVDALSQTGLIGQLKQQLQRLIGYAVFGKIKEDVVQMKGKTFKPPRIMGKEIAHVQVAHLAVVILQGFPGGNGQSDAA